MIRPPPYAPPPSAPPGEEVVYLLHFSAPYCHAQHYMGTTDDLDARLVLHMTGRGARLVEVIVNAGLSFTLARTWKGGRRLERQLKRRHEAPRLCPICRAERAAAERLARHNAHLRPHQGTELATARR
jgi:predicted GIY-YIG superfamily endonuclease